MSVSYAAKISPDDIATLSRESLVLWVSVWVLCVEGAEIGLNFFDSLLGRVEVLFGGIYIAGASGNNGAARRQITSRQSHGH